MHPVTNMESGSVNQTRVTASIVYGVLDRRAYPVPCAAILPWWISDGIPSTKRGASIGMRQAHARHFKGHSVAGRVRSPLRRVLEEPQKKQASGRDLLVSPDKKND